MVQVGEDDELDFVLRGILFDITNCERKIEMAKENVVQEQLQAIQEAQTQSITDGLGKAYDAGVSESFQNQETGDIPPHPQPGADGPEGAPTVQATVNP
jgi:hypothetical protein